MSFYKDLNPFVEYLQSIRKLKNYLSFDIVFPSKWSLPKTMLEDGQLIAFETEGENLQGVSFLCQITEPEIKNTINKISKVIKLNKEKELKERLFKDTIEDLKKTFEKNDLEKLKKLFFDFKLEEQKNNSNEQDGEEPTTLELVE